MPCIPSLFIKLHPHSRQRHGPHCCNSQPAHPPPDRHRKASTAPHPPPAAPRRPAHSSPSQVQSGYTPPTLAGSGDARPAGTELGLYSGRCDEEGKPLGYGLAEWSNIRRYDGGWEGGREEGIGRESWLSTGSCYAGDSTSISQQPPPAIPASPLACPHSSCRATHNRHTFIQL